MPLFKKHSKDAKATGSALHRSESQTSHSSQLSHKARGFFRLSNGSKSSLSPLVSPEKEEPSKERDRRLQKKVSTIAEGMENMNLDDFDSDDDGFDSEASYTSDEDDEDDEEHAHVLQPRPKSSSSTMTSLLSLMGYYALGSKSASDPATLRQLANEELRRTFSLIGPLCKITRLPAFRKDDPHVRDSVIGEEQLHMIKVLTEKLNALLDLKDDLAKQYAYIQGNKTLYDRYGVVRDVIGRGTYGLIKIIDPDVAGTTKEINVEDLYSKGRTLYAVKELQKRPAKDTKSTEPRDKFVERVISEFIILSTLNSRFVVNSVDFMVTLPPASGSASNYIATSNLYEENLKINQVMQCTSGGDLFTYIKNLPSKTQTLEIDEIDCFIKQIAKGLWYMHQHGVAHCDLKLENILINYDYNHLYKGKTKINLKISDFGKSNVFRTKWDSSEQLFPHNRGPLGLEPYIAPEEYLQCQKSGYSLIKKDVWALGIVVLILFNIRRHLFNDDQDDSDHPESLHDLLNSSANTCYLWQVTSIKQHFSCKEHKYKDKVFAEYAKTRALGDYDEKTKEWIIQRRGAFPPIERIFTKIDNDEEGEMNELRRLFMYKLLDIDPRRRITTEDFLQSDWMQNTECCCY